MRKSLMEHRFSELPEVKMPRSTFDRSHGYKTTFDADKIIPILVDDILPGDTVNLDMSFLGRLSTPMYPIMDNVFVDTFFFFVPYRLLWSNFKKFMGERINPDDSVDYTIPVMASPITGYAEHSLADYFGLPTKVTAVFNHNTLPFRAYNLIWNEWFRDQNLQDSVVVDLDDGPDTYTDYTVLKRGKRHDYFTSCLPWLQKGEAVVLGLVGDAPVKGIGIAPNVVAPYSGTQTVMETDGTADYDYKYPAEYTNLVRIKAESSSMNAEPMIYAQMSESLAITVNALRQANVIQELLEIDARYGTRYIESVKAHFGVTSPDSRLQRPEYLGGGSTPLNITPIAQTSESGTTPLGNLGAVGTVSGSGHGFVKSFTEHGVLMGLINVRADLSYMQGMERYWFKETRYDFYLPVLANLGEQVVYNKEIYFDTDFATTGSEAFGYNERWSEYRFKQSKATGLFRSNSTGTLDSWYLIEEFSGLPTLDDTFIKSNTPLDRVIATPTEPHVIMDTYFNMKHTRVMPLYSVPGFVRRF